MARALWRVLREMCDLRSRDRTMRVGGSACAWVSGSGLSFLIPSPRCRAEQLMGWFSRLLSPLKYQDAKDGTFTATMCAALGVCRRAPSALVRRTPATHTLTVWRRPRGSLGAHAHAAAFTTTTAVEEGGIAAMYSAASFEARLLMSVDSGTLSSTRLLLQRSSVVHAPTDGPTA